MATETPPRERASQREPQESVGRSVAWLTVASLGQRASSVVLSVLLRTILGPAKTGVWNLVEVWRQQLGALTLGVHYASDRDMPMLRAQGRHDEVDAVRSVTWTWLIGEACALAIGFWVYWAVGSEGWTADERLGLALVPVLATLTTAYSAYEGFIKNQKEFRVWGLFSLTQIAIDWSVLAWVLVADLRGLLFGLLVGWVLRLGSVWWLVRRLDLFRLRLVFDPKLLKTLLAFGLPLSVWNIAYSLTTRLDSLVVGSHLGTTELGLYYLGPQMALSLGAIPAALSVVSYPNMMERFGAEGAGALVPHLKRYTRGVSLFLSPLTAAAGVYGLAAIVILFLDDFEPGLTAMKVAMLTVLFTHSAYVATQVLLAHKKTRLMIAIALAGLGVQGAIIGIGIASGLTLEWAAWSAVAGQATLSIVTLACALRETQVPRAELGWWARLPLMWACFGALILGVDALVPDGESLVPVAGAVLAQVALFVVAGAALIAIVDRPAFREFRTLTRSAG